jgi:hypothetical protein
MNAPCTQGIREPKGCQLCKSDHKSIFYFCDKFNPPDWQSLKLILSLSSEKFKYFIFMIGKGKKTKDTGTKRSFVHMGIYSIRVVPVYSGDNGQSATTSRFLGNYIIYACTYPYMSNIAHEKIILKCSISLILC